MAVDPTTPEVAPAPKAPPKKKPKTDARSSKKKNQEAVPSEVPSDVIFVSDGPPHRKFLLIFFLSLLLLNCLLGSEGKGRVAEYGVDASADFLSRAIPAFAVRGPPNYVRSILLSLFLFIHFFFVLDPR
jgi:hypothetical protein